MGRAAAAAWRRRNPDFPAVVGGTELRPLFDRTAVVGWLLARDEIEVPDAMPAASQVLVGAGHRTVRVQLDDPHLVLADVVDAEDELSGCSTDADADALADLLEGAGEFGASVERLTPPGTSLLAVVGRVRLSPWWFQPTGLRPGPRRRGPDAGCAAPEPTTTAEPARVPRRAPRSRGRLRGARTRPTVFRGPAP
ncbi:hypothetical protein ACIBEA_16275 [Streptomyces sp. NPDC051555]|uniref:hypothetical protein n=1 Tax=Streptomyces sp. NPDC051555 TaxID=3365657 RepID=UPI00379D1E6F